jgi:hypothetical protein
MAANPPQILEFPKNGMPWRVDGLGKLIYPASSKSEALVEVFLSELHADFSDALSNRSPTKNGGSVHIKVGQLALLKPGYVWLDQMRLPHRTTPKWVEFTLRRSSLEFCRLDSPLVIGDEKVQMLAGNRFFMAESSRRGLADSWVAVVRQPAPGIEFAVIPCPVLFQKCLATSPTAIRRIVWGELHRVVDSHRWIKSEAGVKTFSVEVFKDIDSNEAYAHANLLADFNAHMEYRRFRNALVVNSVNGETRRKLSPHPTHIQFGLPFTNTTTIRVEGKYLPLGTSSEGKNRWGFLVTEIVAMRVQLPFDELIIHRKNDSTKGKNSEEDGLREARWPTRGGESKEPDDGDEIPTHSEDDPLNSLDKICIEEAGGFTATGLKIVKKPKLTQEYKSKNGKVLDGTSDGRVTTGDGRGGDYGSNELDIEAHEAPKSPVTLEAFIETLELMRKKGYLFETVATTPIVRRVNLHKDAINFLPRSIPGVRSWHLSSDAPQAPPRGYIFARLFLGGVWHHFIELERKGTGAHSLAYIRQTDGEAIDGRQIGLFMLDVARCNGWSAYSAYPSWKLQRIKHSPKHGIARFAQFILTATGVLVADALLSGK